MTFVQVIRPNPDIACQPGWCLAYVNEAFGVKKVFPSATSAWFASKTKHTSRDFPVGVWVPVWYGLDTTPLGHVVLLAPDGSVYSTSDLTNVPHHHPDLADLEAYYARYGMDLTYRGWTEDVEGTPVIAATGLAAMAETITPLPEEDTLSAAEVQEIKDHINAVMIGGYTWTDGRHYGIGPVLEETQRRLAAIPAAVWSTPVTRGGKKVPALQELADANTKVSGLAPAIAEIQANTDPAALADLIPDALAQQVIDQLAARLGGK